MAENQENNDIHSIWCNLEKYTFKELNLGIYKLISTIKDHPEMENRLKAYYEVLNGFNSFENMIEDHNKSFAFLDDYIETDTANPFKTDKSKLEEEFKVLRKR